MPNVALVLLAAGSSSRMGTPKQLLPYQGKPLLRHAAECALAAGCNPVIAVLGSSAETIRAALDGLPVEICINSRWAEGMGTSIQSGLMALDKAQVAGAILALADQPYVTADVLQRLIQKQRETGKSIVAARYSGTTGVPVYFTREAFPLLHALAPDQGCKGVILSHLEQAHLVDCPEAAVDIDTPDDFQELARP